MIKEARAVAEGLLSGTCPPDVAPLAARALETEIERRGLQSQYSDALYKITYGEVSHDPRMIRLTCGLLFAPHLSNAHARS